MHGKRFAPVGLVILLSAILSSQSRAAERYPVLHEVLRHFEVAFIDKVNLTALLAGGLQGIKNAAPGCEIQVARPPNMFVIKAGHKEITVSGGAKMNFKQIEAALTNAMDAVIAAKLVDKPAALEHSVIRQLVTHCGDPWSAYLESDLYARLLDDGSGQTGDVGLLFEESKDGLRILDVAPGSPASSEGIKNRTKSRFNWRQT